jgi:hypothetical protein
MACEPGFIFGFYISIAFNCIFVLLAILTPLFLRKCGDLFGFEMATRDVDNEAEPNTHQCKNCKKLVLNDDEVHLESEQAIPSDPPRLTPRLNAPKALSSPAFGGDVNKNLSPSHNIVKTPTLTAEGYVLMDKNTTPNRDSYMKMEVGHISNT